MFGFIKNWITPRPPKEPDPNEPQFGYRRESPADATNYAEIRLREMGVQETRGRKPWDDLYGGEDD